MGVLVRQRVTWLVLTLLAVGAGCGDNLVAVGVTGAGGTGGGDASADVSDVVDVPGSETSDADASDADGARDDGDAHLDAASDADTALDADAPDARDANASDADASDADASDADASDANVVDAGASDADSSLPDTGTDGGNDAPPPVECVISSPALGVTHPILNGVPVAQGGDRASADGDPYQVTFEVTTSIADTQTVELSVNNVATPTMITTYTAQVANGRARFLAVAFPADGDYDVAARCLGKDGAIGLSAPQDYPVDTTPPVFTLTSPQANEFFPPSGLTDDTFPVCGSTSSADAVNLDPALGPRSANGCITVGGSTTCFAIPAADTPGCLPTPCPGDAPFDLIATLGDVAGNVQRTVISNVSCFSTLPTVLIVSPVSDGPTFTDPSRHLLAASAPQAFRDNASAAGAQTDVLACANRAGTIKLFTGHKGDATLTAISALVSTRTALAGDHCPAGFMYAVTFTGVTLPESGEAADTSLMTPTELRADLVDLSATKNSSPLVDLWVDSVAPILLITAPTDICNSYHQSNDIYTSTETVTSTSPDVNLTLTNSTSTQNFSSETFTMLTFPFVVFTQGQNTLAGTARDDAGNVSLLQPNPCVVTVGTTPTP